MRQLILRLAIALLTFTVGVGAAAQWLTRRAARVENQEHTSCCVPDVSEHNSRSHTAPDFYFPAQTFPADTLLERDFVEWYARTLSAMREPSLAARTNRDVEVYRFLWLRSFHPPVAVRLWRHNNEYCITVKQLEDTDRHVDGKFDTSKNLVVNTTRSLTGDEWTTFKHLLARARFWDSPAFDDAPLANDGAFWMLEGAGHGRHHFINRQSPQSGAYYETCVYLLRRSGINIGEAESELY